MEYKHSYMEALCRGTLLYNLVNDIKKFNEKNEINIIADLGGRNGSNITLLNEFGVELKKSYVIDIKPHRLYDEYIYLELDLNKDRLPFNDASVDVVLLIEVIEHLTNPDFILIEVKRVLSKGGICIISTPNLAWWPNIFLLLTGHQPLFTEVSTRKIYGRPGKDILEHLRVFTYVALSEMLRDYRFKIINYKTSQTSIIPNWLKPLDMLISKIVSVWGCNIYAVVKK